MPYLILSHATQGNITLEYHNYALFLYCRLAWLLVMLIAFKELLLRTKLNYR